MIFAIPMHLSHLSTSKPFSVWLALGLGFSTFTPIGISYLILLIFLGFFVVSPTWRSTRAPMPPAWRWILVLLIALPTFTLATNWHPEGLERWTHSWRVAACMALAVTMTYPERVALLYGFMLGCAWAMGVVLIHNHLLPLPEWTIWHQMLSVKGNASSQKWILMAAGAGTCMGLAICLKERPWPHRVGLFAAGLALALTVVSLSISRNSHLVVMALPFLLLVFRFRRPMWWALGVTAAGGLMWLLLANAPAVVSRFDKMWLELSQFANTGDFQGSVGVRAQMFLTAWQQMWTNPWVGTGLGSWETIWAEASHRFPELAGVNNPHNDYLLWGMETGVAGMLLLMALLFKSGADAWRHVHQPMAVAGWILTWTLVITATVNAPFRDAALGMSLWILAVALSTWPSLPEPRTRQPLLPPVQHAP